RLEYPAVARPDPRDGVAERIGDPDVETVGLRKSGSGAGADRGHPEDDRRLGRPVLIERGAAAPPLKRTVHRAGKERRHLDPGHGARRIVGRRRQSRRDPEIKDLQDELAESGVAHVGERTAEPRENTPGPAQEQDRENDDDSKHTSTGQVLPHRTSLHKSGAPSAAGSRLVQGYNFSKPPSEEREQPPAALEREPEMDSIAADGHRESAGACRD